MNDTMKVLDSRGIPTLKALWLGLIIDGDDPPNRHLELAGFSGKELFLELVEVSYDPDSEDLEEEGEEDSEEDENRIPIGYVPNDLDDVEDDVEECDRFPKGCTSCPDEECNGPDAELPDEDETYIELSLAIREKGSEEWFLIADEEVAMNAPLCRFLNTINDTHGL